MITRTRAAIGALLAMSLLAAACSSTPSTPKAVSPSPSSFPACPVGALSHATGATTVTLWYGGLSGETVTTLQRMVAAYNASQTKVVVKADDEGTSYQEVLQKYVSAIPSHELPDIIYGGPVATLVDSGTLIPAQKCMSAAGFPLSSFQPAVRSFYTVDGEFWPGFTAVSEPLLYYNKALFVKAGLNPDNPPGTLVELKADALKLKAAGVAHPLAMVVGTGLGQWLNGIGQPVTNNDNGRSGRATKVFFDTPQARQLLTYFQQMNTEGLLAPFSNTPGQIDQYLALLNKSSAMLFSTSAAATSIAAFLKGTLTSSSLGSGGSSSSASASNLIAAAGPMPGIRQPGKVEVGGAAFYLVHSGNAAREAAGWDFLRFMLSEPEVVAWHLGSSFLPVVGNAAQSPQIQAFWKNTGAGQMSAVAYHELSDINPADPGPLIGPFNRYTAAENQMWEAVIFSGEPVATALATAQSKIDQALTEYNQANGG